MAIPEGYDLNAAIADAVQTCNAGQIDEATARRLLHNIVALAAEPAMAPDSLRNARTALSLTQTEVAHALGVDLRTYQRWEAGDAPLPRWLERKTATMIHRLNDAMEAQ